MGANKVFLIKLLNNFMEWIFIATEVEGLQIRPPPASQILCSSIRWKLPRISVIQNVLQDGISMALRHIFHFDANKRKGYYQWGDGYRVLWIADIVCRVNTNVFLFSKLLKKKFFFNNKSILHGLTCN